MRPVLGQGSYGTVRRVCSKADGRVYAVKSAKAGQRSREEQGILELVNSLRSPFIVRLHGAYEEHGRKHLLLDYVDGQDLARCLQQCRPWAFSEGSVRFVAAELCLALQALHSLSIVHRDVKPGNVVLGADGHIVLVDFNCAVQGSMPAGACKMYLSPNSLPAPEMVQGREQGAEVDWWCLGVMVHELMLGYLPWNHLVRGGSTCEVELLHRIAHADVALPCFGIPAQARDLMEGLLCRDPYERVGAQGAGQVMAHPFFEDAEWERLARKEAVPEALLPQRQIAGIEVCRETQETQELLAEVDAVYEAERKSLRRAYVHDMQELAAGVDAVYEVERQEMQEASKAGTTESRIPESELRWQLEEKEEKLAEAEDRCRRFCKIRRELEEDLDAWEEGLDSVKTALKTARVWGKVYEELRKAGCEDVLDSEEDSEGSCSDPA